MFSVKKAAWNAKQLIRLKSPFSIEFFFFYCDSYHNSFETCPSLLDLRNDLIARAEMNHGLFLTLAIPLPAPLPWYPEGFFVSAPSSAGSSSLAVVSWKIAFPVKLPPLIRWHHVKSRPTCFLMCVIIDYEFGHQLCWRPFDIYCFIKSLYLVSSISKIRIMTPLQSALRAMGLTYQHLGCVFLRVSYWPSWNSLWSCNKKLKFIYPWGSYCS